MTMQGNTTFAEPPVGPDGLIDITAIARRVDSAPAPQRAPLDLAALDAATPAAPTAPFAQQTPVQPEQPQVSDHQLLLNEVANEQPTTDRPDDVPQDALKVPLHNRDGEIVAEFWVLHPDDWPSSANEDPDYKRYFSWALKVLATEEQKDLWRALDPTNREAGQFVSDWVIATGADPKGART